MGDSNGKMGLWSCTSTIIAACIGSAIFSISGMTIWYAGASAIVSWIAAAVIYGLFGTVLVHLVQCFPRSGGIYIFPRRAFGCPRGALTGFLSGWGYIISSIIGIGFSAIYAGIYLQAGFPELKSPIAVSVTTCLLACAVVLSGTGKTKKVQNVLILVLIAAILVYCSTAIFSGCFDPSRFRGFFTSGSKGATGFISAIPLAMMAYGGCVAIAFMASDVKKPRQNVPRSLILGLAAVASLYALLIACVIGTLPIELMADDQSARYIPIFASVTDGSLTGFHWLTKVISVSAFLALFTSMVAMMQINARAMEAISAEGLLPEAFYTRGSEGIAPAPVLIMTAVSILLSAFPHWTETLITLGAVLTIVSIAVTCLALWKVGKDTNDIHRMTLALSVLVILALCYVPDLAGGNLKMWLFTAAVYLAALTIWFVCRKKGALHFSGIVVHGKGHGHLAGMPTANLEPLTGEIPPGDGVWHCRVYLDGHIYNGLTNVGLRPSDDDSPVPTVETMILDFSGDIYGQEVTLAFVRRIRDTRRFSSLGELKMQIDEDIATLEHF